MQMSKMASGLRRRPVPPPWAGMVVRQRGSFSVWHVCQYNLNACAYVFVLECSLIRCCGALHRRPVQLVGSAPAGSLLLYTHERR